MKPVALLLVLAASLGAAHLALAQGGTKPALVSAVIEVLGADMAPSCKASDVDRAVKLAAFCNGKKQCRYAPEEADAASEACARESLALWNCGDGNTRQVPLASPPGQGRAISLECPQTVPVSTASAVAAPDGEAAAKTGAQKAAPGEPETIHAEDTKLPSVAAVRTKTAQPVIDMSAAGIERECDRMNKTAFDGMPGNGPPAEQRLADIHANLWKAPDHSANAAIHSPGRVGAVSGDAASGCF